MDKQKLYEIIETKSPLLTDLSDKIWEYAELSMLEYKSMAAYVQILKEEGFEVVEICATYPPLSPALSVPASLLSES